MPFRRRPPEFARLMASAVDAKGDYFPGHSDGVAYLVTMMAVEAELEADHVAKLQVAGLLHDIGKVMIPERILSAQRRLTEEEFRVVQTHSVWGEEIAKRIDGLAFALPWIRHHHERWDGRGYPDGLRGDEIPFESRLILVADAFHVMTSERPYKGVRSRQEALDELRANQGTQFCPIASDLLLSRHERTR